VTHDGARVDLGQAVCGHRFARRGRTTATTAGPRSVLGTPSLMWTDNGAATVDLTGQDDLVVPAVLVRICPEDVTLSPVAARF
jgi:hypothetical protein